MWTYMATWIIKDGAPELGRGSVLLRTGLRAGCLTVSPAWDRADGLEETSDRRGPHVYDLTGLAGTAHDIYAGDDPAGRHAGAEFLITTGDLDFTTQAALPASQIPSGSRVTVQCMLSVVADYEWDAFGLPDLRRDWHVRALEIEHRHIQDAPPSSRQTLAGPPGKVIRSCEIERMSRWDDDRDSTIQAWYVLDLQPVRAH